MLRVAQTFVLAGEHASRFLPAPWAQIFTVIYEAVVKDPPKSLEEFAHRLGGLHLQMGGPRHRAARPAAHRPAGVVAAGRPAPEAG